MDAGVSMDAEVSVAPRSVTSRNVISINAISINAISSQAGGRMQMRRNRAGWRKVFPQTEGS